jgi:hypothetical protein
MILSGYQQQITKRYLSKMHSYYRNTINTVEEWLDHIKEQEHEPDSTIDSIYPVQSTALLYEEIGGCQDEK